MLVIVGAGGHALEVFDELLRLNPDQSKNGIFCYDEDYSKLRFKQNIKILHSKEELKREVPGSFNFCLGVGNPQIRKKMTYFLNQLGGVYIPIKSKNAVISASAKGDFDLLSQSFIGPDVTIGLGSLINVGAKIHHESSLGEFVEIGPGAMVLGNAKVGECTQIGAGAIVLPGVSVGRNCTIGAGSVVNRNIEDGVTAYGVPCKMKVD